MQRNTKWHLDRKRLSADDSLSLGSWINHFGDELEACIELCAASEIRAGDYRTWPHVLTETAQTAAVGAQIVGCWLSGGWTIGVVGNNPHLVPYLNRVLTNLGHHELAELAAKAAAMFSADAPYDGNDGERMAAIINQLESDDAYLAILDQADSMSERDWGYEEGAFRSVIAYANTNRDAVVWL